MVEPTANGLLDRVVRVCTDLLAINCMFVGFDATGCIDADLDLDTAPGVCGTSGRILSLLRLSNHDS